MRGPQRRDRPLRVVLVVGTLQVGGTETQLVALASGLRARGHDVHVVALSENGPLAAPLRAAGVDVRIFAFGAVRRRYADRRRPLRAVLDELRELYRVWRHLRAVRPDVCHAFLYTCNTLVLPLARLAGVPLRVAGRRGPDPRLNGLRHRMVEAVGRRATSIYLCNSRAGADEVVRGEGVPDSRVLVIANGVEIPEAVAEPARQPARGVMVAQLRPGKGHEDLLAALASLATAPKVCLVGDGPQRSAIEELIGGLGLAGVLELAGQRADVPQLLPEYQFALLPSHGEGLPNAVLEAMAAGLPVIATTVGGIPDVVADGVTGILVPPRSPEALAAAIARLAADPDLRARLGAAAREAAMDYSVSACVNRHEAVYRKWLS